MLFLAAQSNINFIQAIPAHLSKKSRSASYDEVTSAAKIYRNIIPETEPINDQATKFQKSLISSN